MDGAQVETQVSEADVAVIFMDLLAWARDNGDVAMWRTLLRERGGTRQDWIRVQGSPLQNAALDDAIRDLPAVMEHEALHGAASMLRIDRPDVLRVLEWRARQYPTAWGAILAQARDRAQG